MLSCVLSFSGPPSCCPRPLGSPESPTCPNRVCPCSFPDTPQCPPDVPGSNGNPSFSKQLLNSQTSVTGRGEKEQLRAVGASTVFL